MNSKICKGPEMGPCGTPDMLYTETHSTCGNYISVYCLSIVLKVDLAFNFHSWYFQLTQRTSTANLECHNK